SSSTGAERSATKIVDAAASEDRALSSARAVDVDKELAPSSSRDDKDKVKGSRGRPKNHDMRKRTGEREKKTRASIGQKKSGPVRCEKREDLLGTAGGLTSSHQPSSTNKKRRLSDSKPDEKGRQDG
ncbi:unnamed protein product, partial [Amoebophrya sp. A25]